METPLGPPLERTEKVNGAAAMTPRVVLMGRPARLRAWRAWFAPGTTVLELAQGTARPRATSGGQS